MVRQSSPKSSQKPMRLRRIGDTTSVVTAARTRASADLTRPDQTGWYDTVRASAGTADPLAMYLENAPVRRHATSAGQKIISSGTAPNVSWKPKEKLKIALRSKGRRLPARPPRRQHRHPTMSKRLPQWLHYTRNNHRGWYFMTVPGVDRAVADAISGKNDDM